MSWYDDDKAMNDLWDSGCDDPEMFVEYRKSEEKDKLLKDYGLNPDKYRRGSSSSSSGSSSSEGCYIATCVYGSYDCPEVWVLRRYRDYYLDNTMLGRGFIKTYYAISPRLVALFGDKDWFKALWKKYLDKKVYKLRRLNYSDKPYIDKY